MNCYFFFSDGDKNSFNNLLIIKKKGYNIII